MLRTTASPISVHEFYLALTRSWQATRKVPRPLRVGIAVSGGVDSMALSYLCKMLEINNLGTFTFRAFIVDHRVRPESTSEAQKVGKSLRKLGIPCTTIRLRWRARYQFAPALSNFESVARRLRYRALGKACKHFNMSSLLLAHHEDDQAETVLSRLLGGYTHYGLQGMRAKANIPECHGMYGVDASGQSHKCPQTDLMPIPQIVIDRGSIDFAGGGLQICRPLLAFGKERLISTCMNGRITWFEDSSNENHRLTIRNTVRKLLKHEQLPKAFQKQSLLCLSRIVGKKFERQLSAAKKIAAKLIIKSLDLRSGKLEFAIQRELLSSSRTKSLEQRVLQCRAALLIAKSLAQVTSHFTIANAPGVMIAIARVFPLLCNVSTKEGDICMIHESRSFTALGVYWRLLKSDGSTELWSLSRELTKRSATKPFCCWGPSSSSLRLGEVSFVASFWTWQLFDNRYWIRVRDRSERKIAVRLLAENDMASLRESAKSKSNDEACLNKLLKELAPGKIRWTLPVLVDCNTDEPLVLPTLEKRSAQGENLLEWQVLYKKM